MVARDAFLMAGAEPFSAPKGETWLVPSAVLIGLRVGGRSQLWQWGEPEASRLALSVPRLRGFSMRKQISCGVFSPRVKWSRSTLAGSA